MCQVGSSDQQYQNKIQQEKKTFIVEQHQPQQQQKADQWVYMEKEKYKNASDKASSEAANYKKQLRSKQTAEEAEAEAKAEAERLQKEKYEEMSKELDHIKAVSAYKNISTEETVENLIDAVADGDHSAIAAIIQKEIKAAVTAKEAEWMKSRPPINVGGGENTISKEQFNKMKYQERVEFKSKNPELYKKYTE